MSDYSRNSLDQITIEHLNCTKESLKDHANLTSDLHIDSLDRVELAMAYEDDFDISINDEVAAEWAVYGDIVKTVEGLCENEC